MVETFFKTLKAELVWRTIFQSRIEAAIGNRPLHRRLLQRFIRTHISLCG